MYGPTARSLAKEPVVNACGRDARAPSAFAYHKFVVHPRLLVVFELPADESRWMTVTGEELVLRRSAYWLSLQQGFAEDAEQQTVSVSIPEKNLFDVEGLRELIERSRKGEI